MDGATILVVEDEELVRWSLLQKLEERGYRALGAGTGLGAEESCAAGPVDLVLLDMRLPDTDGLELLARLRQAVPDTPVVLMTAYSSIESAVQAIKQGAYHYVKKPFEMDEMVLVVEQALETTRLRREVRAFRARESEPYGFDRIVGRSQAMEETRALLGKVAASPATTVLLTGESGTGKDLAAKAIHFGSERASGPFVHITCSAVPEALLESELFGHEKGAFTDARQQKKGLLEGAHRGTVFLDEIGEMSTGLQAKLLRFLEEKAFKRVGGAADVRVDVRVIAATNRDLERQVREGAFREDLYYRLRVVPLTLPPLRERRGDVAILARYYLDHFNREFRRSLAGFSPAALALLEAHHWPGNVRELRNAVERAALLAEGRVVDVPDLPLPPPTGDGRPGFRLPREGVDLEAVERDLVGQALERSGGNHTRAAALLGMTRDQVRYRAEKFGLGPKGDPPSD